MTDSTDNAQTPPAFGTPEHNRCPYPFYEAARASGQAVQIQGTDLHMVSRYEDVKSAAMDVATFSSHRATFGVGDPELEAIMRTGWPSVGALVTSDPPQHTRYRKLVARGFTPGAVANYAPLVDEVITGLVEEIGDSQTVDLMSEFAGPMATRIISRIMGVPMQDEARFTAWADMIAESVAGYLPRERALECARGLVAMQHYFAEMLDERRANPGTDLVSTLVTAEESDAPMLEVPEILEIIRIFVAGGAESTSSLLGTAFFMMLTHRDQFDQVCADRALVAPMLEEALRLESPVQWNPRLLEASSATVGAAEIDRGQRIMLCWGAANRDPDKFGNAADSFDIHRDASRHLAFGHGYHFCVGAPLARLEATVAVNKLLDAFEDIELAVEPNAITYVGRGVVRRIESLPLRVRRRS